MKKFIDIVLSIIISMILGALCFPIMSFITSIFNITGGVWEAIIQIGFPVVFTLIVYGISLLLEDKDIRIIKIVFIITLLVINYFGFYNLIKQDGNSTIKEVRESAIFATAVPAVILIIITIKLYFRSDDDYSISSSTENITTMNWGAGMSTTKIGDTRIDSMKVGDNLEIHRVKDSNGNTKTVRHWKF